MFPVLVTLHALSAVLWIGGVFYAYVVLRPSVGFLAGPDRLSLWSRVFRRFLRWVWLFVAVILVTGYTGLFTQFGGFAHSPVFLHAMQLAGWVTILLFVWLYFGPVRRLHQCVAAQDWANAGAAIPSIRRLVAAILWLGMLTVVIGVAGPFTG